jgi:hypothetical protein
MVRNLPFRIAAVGLPAIGGLLGMPLAMNPFYGDPRGIFGPYFVIALPVYAAVVAMPGYLSCLSSDVGARASSPVRRWWIRGSLLLGAAASIAGIWGATQMALFGPPAVGALICVVVLAVRFERGPTA